METYKAFKIFITDDGFSLTLYEQHLCNLGYTDIHLFSNGADILNRLSESPDIILLDFFMARPDGLTVLKEIKCCNPDIYVIMVSGQEYVQIAVDAMKYGVFDYVIKGEMTLSISRIYLLRSNRLESSSNQKKEFFQEVFSHRSNIIKPLVTRVSSLPEFFTLHFIPYFGRLS